MRFSLAPRKSPAALAPRKSRASDALAARKATVPREPKPTLSMTAAWTPAKPGMIVPNWPSWIEVGEPRLASVSKR